MSPAAQRAIAGPGHSLPEGERDNRGLPCCKPLLDPETLGREVYLHFMLFRRETFLR